MCRKHHFNSSIQSKRTRTREEPAFDEKRCRNPVGYLLCTLHFSRQGLKVKSVGWKWTLWFRELCDSVTTSMWTIDCFSAGQHDGLWWQKHKGERLRKDKRNKGWKHGQGAVSHCEGLFCSSSSTSSYCPQHRNDSRQHDSYSSSVSIWGAPRLVQFISVWGASSSKPSHLPHHGQSNSWMSKEHLSDLSNTWSL